MSKFSRRNGFSVGLVAGGFFAIFCLVWVVGLNYCPESPCDHNYSYKETPTNDENRLPDAFGSNGGTDAHPADQNEHPKYYEHQDLKAQELMAEATKWIVVLTGMSLILGALGAAAIFWTLYETRKLSKVTRDIGEAQIMAYVSISGVEVSLNKRSPSQRELFVNIGVVRTGQSPANSVAVNIRPFDGMVLAQPEMRGKPVYEQMFGDISGDERPVIQSNIMVTEDFLRTRKSRDGIDKFWCEIVVDLTYNDVFDREFTKPFKFYGWCSFAGGNPLIRAKNHDEWIEPGMWL